MGYPSYARNRACALPSPSPLNNVMAKIVPMVQLAAHAKSSTLCARTVVRSYNQIFSTWWVTTISCSYGATLELRYKLRYWCRLRHIELWHLLKYTCCCCCFFTSSLFYSSYEWWGFFPMSDEVSFLWVMKFFRFRQLHHVPVTSGQ